MCFNVNARMKHGNGNEEHKLYIELADTRPFCNIIGGKATAT